MHVQELESEPCGNGARLLDRMRRGCLGQIHKTAIIAEVDRGEFRVVIETEPADHQALEMPQQEIRQVESARLGIVQLRERRAPCEELITVRAGKPFDLFRLQQYIELAARAAVGVRHEDLPVVRAVSTDLLAYRGHDALRTVVQLRGQ